MNNKTIPIFDCVFDIDKHLEFYKALGFSITYYQKSPYRFASVQSDFTEISFYADKSFKIGDKASGCYIVVDNIEIIYDKLKENLKKSYGKIPTKGMPRISRINQTSEDFRVNITDYSGNSLIIGEPIKNIQINEKSISKLEKIYNQAYSYAYSKEDFLASRNLLESYFNKYSKDMSQEQFLKAKILELDISLILEKKEKQLDILKEIENINFKENIKEYKRFLEIKEELITNN